MSAFLRNAWYVAGWADEIKTGSLVQRTLLNESILFYRTENGTPVALGNRCPHRFAPLHLGKLVGDNVQCGYHGLQFSTKGQCVLNPQSDVIPARAKVKAYPVRERHSLIWIWMGDVEKADAVPIPDFNCMDPDRFWVGKGYLNVQANYVLEADNIMDLSHIEFLHKGTLGSEAIKRAKAEVAQDGNTVWSKRLTNAEIMPDFLYETLGLPPGQKVDRWLDVRWNAPAVMWLDVGATPTGHPREKGRNVASLHLFSPETERTTHYWFGSSLSKALGPDGEQKVQKRNAIAKVPFATEDLPMLEAQQASMGDADFWDLNPILLPGDGGAIRARKVLEKMIADEQQASATSRSRQTN